MMHGKKSLRMNSKGVALITALLFTLIAIGIVVATITLITKGTQISGMFKLYRTAMEAAEGAVHFFAREFLPKKLSGQTLSSLGDYGGVVSYGIDDACFTTKLTSLTEYWTCGSSSLDPKSSPDITFTFGQYTAYLKITNTLDGNSDISGFALEGMGVVEAGSGAITPQHFPYIYRIDTLAEKTSGPMERAILNALYAY